MRMVVDISENWETKILNMSDSEIMDFLYTIVRNGTPIPEGHGRLVDMSKVIVKLMQYYDREKTIGQCLDEVPTVIEADWGDAK